MSTHLKTLPMQRMQRMPHRRSWQPGLPLPDDAVHPPATPPAAPPPPPEAAERPDGVSEAEWTALGDPGKAAIVRERARATAAEQALAASRATPPKPKPAPKPPKAVDQPDMAEQITAAVTAAMAPMFERDAEREATRAAGLVRDAVTGAASDRFHDATDALAHIDLTTLTDGEGRADQAKVTAALDDLLTRKPHLGKAVDTRRHAAPGAPVGAGGTAQAPLDDRVKATLARMQAASGVKFADA